MNLLSPGRCGRWWRLFRSSRSAQRGVRQIQATGHGFAAILKAGSVVHDSGGESLAVRDQLQDVQQIQAPDDAFAAILVDGSVVTWDDADRAGDSSAVRDQLKGAQQIQATTCAFAAIREDGSLAV